MAADVDQAFSEALAHHQAGRLAEAEKRYRAILEKVPNHADSLHLLGVLALQAGHPEPALTLIQHAIRFRPDGAVYQSNFGQVLERLNRFDEAERAYRTAIALDPKGAEAFNNLGRLLQGRGDLEEAETNFLEAIEINPDYAEPHTNLGNLLKDRGDLDGAIAAFRRAVELRPDLSLLHSNLLLTLHYHAGFSAKDLKREHDLWASRHVAPLESERSPLANDADPDRRLRIGYVSPDFRDHAVARFMLPLLENHDRNEVELFAYSDVERADEITGSIRKQFDHWRESAALSDAGLAARIREDRIDILVDLAAHSARNRLLTFARKPAPVQVTYLAYCSTTGVDAIDYRLTDRFLDPESDDETRYTEHSVRLPDCYWCYAAPALPEDALTSSERVPGPPTFGCLNNFAKVTDTTLDLWIRLLDRVPDSRLLIFARAEWHQDRVREAFGEAGLDEDRLEFVGLQSFPDYLATYRKIDVALDPMPYTGGTTTCDALWMGVPVVTLAGQTAVSRGGASLLSNVGLPELVARSEDEYVDIAADLIGDADRLASLRAGLREKLESSPVMDAPRFVRGLEAAFREMWRTWCRTQA
jgi:predicted O-linked N-acetylglucosamine transferase (SPINDLY family)